MAIRNTVLNLFLYIAFGNNLYVIFCTAYPWMIARIGGTSEKMKNALIEDLEDKKNISKVIGKRL